jgi:hypothetical protein
VQFVYSKRVAALVSIGWLNVVEQFEHVFFNNLECLDVVPWLFCEPIVLNIVRLVFPPMSLDKRTIRSSEWLYNGHSSILITLKQSCRDSTPIASSHGFIVSVLARCGVRFETMSTDWRYRFDAACPIGRLRLGLFSRCGKQDGVPGVVEHVGDDPMLTGTGSRAMKKVRAVLANASGSPMWQSSKLYRLADEKRETILAACSKCEWRAAFSRDDLIASHGADCAMPNLHYVEPIEGGRRRE